MRTTELGQNALNLLSRKRQEKIFTAELFVCLVIRVFALVQIFFQSECTCNVRWALNSYCHDDWMWKAFSRPATLQWYWLLLLTPAKTQSWPLASLALPGFDLFSSISLFKTKRSTKYQAQGKAKQRKKRTEWRNWIWSRTVNFESWSQQQRYLEAMR